MSIRYSTKTAKNSKNYERYDHQFFVRNLWIIVHICRAGLLDLFLVMASKVGVMAAPASSYNACRLVYTGSNIRLTVA